MNKKIVVMETFAIMAAVLLLNLPLAASTNVNIYLNGQVRETFQLTNEDLIGKDITFIHDPRDITWTNEKVNVRLWSASLDHAIKKVYLFKCKKSNPVKCLKTQPQVFDNWVDTEINWKDMAEGQQLNRQEGNLLILVKLEGMSSRVGWTGFWINVKRHSKESFSQDSVNIDSVDIHAKSVNYISAIKTYLMNFGMVPFNWVEKVVFNNARTLYGISSSERDIDASPPHFNAAQAGLREIKSIGQDFYFILPEEDSIVKNPLTIHNNPSFSCGNGNIETDLGETSENCCYDVGCPNGQYCDIADLENPSEGTCRNIEEISIRVPSPQNPIINDCSQNFELTLTANINNAPSSLPETASGLVTIDETVHQASCVKSGSSYLCTVSLTPEAKCGAFSKPVNGSELNVSLLFNDGPSQVEMTEGVRIPAFNIQYDCSCPEGSFCDFEDKLCKNEADIVLTVINMTSILENYQPGVTTVDIYAKINNPPSDMRATGWEAVLGNFTSDTGSITGSSRSIECTGSRETGHVYFCQVRFDIAGYSKDVKYVIRNNQLSATITYSDASVTERIKDISTPLFDVIIPSHECGDGTCNIDEDSDKCCFDCGCPNEGDFCNKYIGCQPLEDIGLDVINLEPEMFYDCTQPHSLEILTKVQGLPTDVIYPFNHIRYYQNGELTNWMIDCEQPNEFTEEMKCHLLIPAINGCELPYYTVGGNEMEISMTFTNGTNPDSKQPIQLTHTIKAGFDDVNIIPTYHCGDNKCETELGENASNCCIDCPCEQDFEFSDNYYCDYAPLAGVNGTCRRKSDIALVVDYPTTPIAFESCEFPNTFFVIAHVENQPTGMRVENIMGDLNGTPAPYIRCEEKRFPGDVPYQYNCSIRIPSIFECVQGQTYEYNPNTLSFFISYTNGASGLETMTLTPARYPPVKITQKIRSLYQIMENYKNKIMSIMYRLLDYGEKAMKYADLCAKLMITAAILSLVLTVSFIAIGAGATNKLGLGGPEGSLKEASEYGQAGAKIGESLVTAVKAVCDSLLTYVKVLMTMKRMEMELFNMQRCIEIYQHNLDTNLCEGNHEGCYAEIQGCIDGGFGKVTARVNEVEGYLDKIQTNSQVLTTNILGSLETLDRTFGAGADRYYIVWGTGISIGENIPGSKKICEHDTSLPRTPSSGPSQYIQRCTDSKIKFMVSGNTYGCDRSKGDQFRVYIDQNYPETYAVGTVYEPASKVFNNVYGPHTVTFFCDRARDGAADQVFNSDTDRELHTLNVEFLENKDYENPTADTDRAFWKYKSCNCGIEREGGEVHLDQTNSGAGTTTQTGPLVLYDEKDPNNPWADHSVPNHDDDGEVWAKLDLPEDASEGEIVWKTGTLRDTKETVGTNEEWASYKYDSDGQKEVELYATIAGDERKLGASTIFVDFNYPDLDVSVDVGEPNEVRMTVEADDGAGTGVIKCEIDWNDGSDEEVLNFPSSQRALYSHEYEKAEDYQISVTCWDKLGFARTVTGTLKVAGGMITFNKDATTPQSRVDVSQGSGGTSGGGTEGGTSGGGEDTLPDFAISNYKLTKSDVSAFITFKTNHMATCTLTVTSQEYVGYEYVQEDQFNDGYFIFDVNNPPLQPQTSYSVSIDCKSEKNQQTTSKSDTFTTESSSGTVDLKITDANVDAENTRAVLTFKTNRDSTCHAEISAQSTSDETGSDFSIPLENLEEGTFYIVKIICTEGTNSAEEEISFTTTSELEITEFEYEPDFNTITVSFFTNKDATCNAYLSHIITSTSKSRESTGVVHILFFDELEEGEYSCDIVCNTVDGETVDFGKVITTLISPQISNLNVETLSDSLLVSFNTNTEATCLTKIFRGGEDNHFFEFTETTGNAFEFTTVGQLTAAQFQALFSAGTDYTAKAICVDSSGDEITSQSQGFQIPAS